MEHRESVDASGERIEADEWGKVAKDIRKSFRLNVLLFFGAIVAALIVRLVRDS